MFRKSSGIEDFLDNKLSRFCRTFMSHGVKIFVMNPSKIDKNWAIQKFYAPKRSSTIFRGKDLVSQYRKFRGVRFCLSEKF